MLGKTAHCSRIPVSEPSYYPDKCDDDNRRDRRIDRIGPVRRCPESERDRRRLFVMKTASQRRSHAFMPGFEGLETRRVPTSFAAGSAVLVGRVQAAPQPRIPYVFTQPEDGREPILRAVAAARRSIRIGICNLGDPVIADALAAAADRGVEVRVIVDRKDYLAKPEEQAVVAGLIERGVPVHLSNPAFPRSFPKYVVIDQRQALVMTMCLVPPTFVDTRDFGLVLANPAIIREITRVFENDWRISALPGVPVPPSNATPPLHVPNLIWGPVNAVPRLSAVIRSAHRTLDVTTEELGDPHLEGLLIDAVNRGVRVRMITPEHTREGGDNTDQVEFLRSAGVEVRMTTGQFPPRGDMPYMHAKTMVADGRLAYLGSFDLKTSQTTQDRELGIVFRQKNLVAPVRDQFEADWNRLTVI
jgi:phosphatidylserine/phosphatidylglycerophosphate/cardiolipin synthase-like enzyme